mmetsp:Transcript_33254/g.53557  ORF Transcript_33254/g.53557 Transcript_33254/m.53557 type:complete len:126 (+) Transcript_33254:421-798(+)
MRSVWYEKNGDGSLHVDNNAPRPTRKKGCVLVRVLAASVNPVDWKLIANRSTIPCKYWSGLCWEVSNQMFVASATKQKGRWLRCVRHRRRSGSRLGVQERRQGLQLSAGTLLLSQCFVCLFVPVF